LRTFVAIDLDPGIKRALSDFIRRLKKAGPEGTSWAREEGMHLTLKFLGEIDESRAEAVAGVMDEAVFDCRPFPFQVRGTGYFPNARFPRVLWAGIAPSAELDFLQTRLEFGLAAIGFERENRPFHPHLTLGRVRSVSGIRDALTELELQKNADFGTMTASKLALFRSVLRPSGAEYSVLKESPFR
jgi:2'-5' RNA ligase